MKLLFFLIVLHVIVLHSCGFYKLKVRPSTSKQIRTHFGVIFALLWWSGTEPTLSLRYACIIYITIWFYIYINLSLLLKFPAFSASFHKTANKLYFVNLYIEKCYWPPLVRECWGSWLYFEGHFQCCFVDSWPRHPCGWTMVAGGCGGDGHGRGQLSVSYRNVGPKTLAIFHSCQLCSLNASRIAPSLTKENKLPDLKKA